MSTWPPPADAPPSSNSASASASPTSPRHGSISGLFDSAKRTLKRVGSNKESSGPQFELAFDPLDAYSDPEHPLRLQPTLTVDDAVRLAPCTPRDLSLAPHLGYLHITSDFRSFSMRSMGGATSLARRTPRGVLLLGPTVGSVELTRSCSVGADLFDPALRLHSASSGSILDKLSTTINSVRKNSENSGSMRALKANYLKAEFTKVPSCPASLTLSSLTYAL